MKDHSIHLMNGDVDEIRFTWQVASDRHAGIGAYCPFTAVATPIGIIFQGECGIYSYRPGGKPELISGAIQQTLEGLDYSYRTSFVAGFSQCLRAYIISFTTSGQTVNDQTFAYFIDTGAWAPWQFGMGEIYPSCWATFHVGSQLKPFFGSSNGFVYETENSNSVDGPTSGTETGTVTASSATSITDTTAAFYATGDDLLGISATVIHTSTTHESQQISSNASTALTTDTWTTTPVVGTTYYVGAIEGILSLGRVDCGSSGLKRFTRITFEFQQQTHSINLLLGFTIDNDTEPTTITAISPQQFKFSVPVDRIGVGISPYLRTVGTDNAFELLRIDVEYQL